MPVERPETIYVCDLSGKSAPALEFTDGIEDDDPMEDAPQGWSQVIVRTRVANPDWSRARQAYAGARASIKNEYKDQKDASLLQAAMFALEQQMVPFLSVPQYTVNEGSLWVHPDYITDLMKRLDPELAKAHQENALFIQEDEDDFDDFDEEEDEEELEEVPVPEPSVAKDKPKAKAKKAAAG